MSILSVVVLVFVLALCHAHVDPSVSKVLCHHLQTNLNSAVSLAVFPDSIQVSGTFVTVSYSNPTPNENDWVGMYLVSDDPNTVVPIEYQLANYSAGYLQSGNGSLLIRVLNMRDDVIFYLFTGGLSYPVLAASSNIVFVPNYNEPLQGRLSLTHVPSEMLVTWTTKNSTNPTIQYGTTSGTYIVTAPAEHTTSYNQSDMCGAPATTTGYRPAGVFHTGRMTGLRANQIYYYRFGDMAAGLWSEEYSFIATPTSGQAVKMFAFGDLGQATIDDTQEQNVVPASLNTTTAMIQELEGVQLVAHVGDISYARGYASQWELFHDQIQPIAARIPWMTAIGNHERDWPGSGSARGSTDSGGECGVAYETRFVMPTPQQDQPWYSLNVGVVHLIMMSTEHVFAPDTPQYNFILSDLLSINREQTPWVIFAGHRPFYIDSINWDPNDGDQTVAVELRATFEDMFYKHKVDLIFGAHHHSYQRTCPVYKGKCMSTAADGYAAPVIVDLGMAGMGNSQNIEPSQPEIFEIVNDTTHGFMILEANMTTLTMQYIEGLDRNVLDSFTLVKP